MKRKTLNSKTPTKLRKWVSPKLIILSEKTYTPSKTVIHAQYGGGGTVTHDTAQMAIQQSMYVACE